MNRRWQLSQYSCGNCFGNCFGSNCFGWPEAATLPISVEKHTATVLTDGSVLVVGGKSATGAVSDVYRWSPGD